MNEYGEVGPGLPGYEGDLDEIAMFLSKRFGYTVDVLFTARSTAKHVVLVRLNSVSAHVRPPGFSEAGDALFVGIDNGPAAWMPMGWLHWSYVAQYLERRWGDGEDDHPFADFLNGVLTRLGVPAGEVLA